MTRALRRLLAGVGVAAAAPAGLAAQGPCRVAEVLIAPAQLVVNVGRDSTLSATGYDVAGSPCESARFRWSSSDVHVATVDSAGVVRGVGKGVAIITVRTGAGAEARAASAVVISEGKGVGAINLPAPGAAPPLAPRTTAGYWMPLFTGGGDSAALEYARTLGLRLDSAVLSLIDVFRATTGMATPGAAHPLVLSSREKRRWERCKLLGSDLVSLGAAVTAVRESLPDGVARRAAAGLGHALRDLAAPAECDNIHSMVEFPERWSRWQWQQNYQNSVNGFYGRWWPEVRAVHEADRVFLRSLNVLLPAARAVPMIPGLPSRPPTIGGFGAVGEPDAAQPAPAPSSGGPKTPPPISRDADRDGVPDPRDRCADTRPGSRVDHNGCAPQLDGQAGAPPSPADSQLVGKPHPPQVIGHIRAGQTEEGRLEPGDFTMGDATWVDIWYVEAEAGARLVIDVSSRQFDPYIQLLDPMGRKLAEDDDGGSGNSARIQFTFRERGRHQLVVNISGDVPRAGSYTVRVSQW